MAHALSRILQIPNAFFDDLSRPFAERLGLGRLSRHFDVVIYSYLFFTATQHVIVPAISRRLSPLSYGAIKGRAGRNKWLTRGVSMAHALVVLPLASRCLSLKNLGEDRAFGWDGRAGTVQAIAVGYFIWDTLDGVLNFESIGFVIHGISCFLIYLMTFRPFLSYYAIRCLFWETSTIFLNIHWFLDKTGHTGSRKQLVNGALLVSSFFFVRIIWGGLVSYEFLVTLFDVRDKIPPSLFLVYSGGNMLLQGLNWYWFYSMIQALKRRFKSSGDPKSEKGVRGLNGTGGKVE